MRPRAERAVTGALAPSGQTAAAGGPACHGGGADG